MEISLVGNLFSMVGFFQLYQLQDLQLYFIGYMLAQSPNLQLVTEHREDLLIL